jgi:RimJ/RimL family protein N-acetyltransferase
MSLSITTPRLLIRPIQPEDGPALLPLIDNWNVVKWLAVVPWPYTVADMTWFIEHIAAPRADGPDPIFTILLGGKLPIGVAECKGRTAESADKSDDLDLGFWIGEPHWGHGFMSEAISALLARAFSEPKAAAIRSGVFAGNDRSLRVHEKLGFERTGTRLSGCRARGTDVPLITLRLMRDRFERE